MAPEVYVCGQLFETDLQLLARQGVRTIVNNRFDDESTGQPKSADLAKAAEELGMTFVHFPVDAISISDSDLREFAKTSDDLERPLFLFSRSGKRSIKLWEKAELL
jgi:uncharacterized protein (TIGR01244 family)